MYPIAAGAALRYAFVGAGRRSLPLGPPIGARGNCRQGLRAKDTLAEWLRRRPAKPMGSPRVGSNPTGVAIAYVGGFALRPGQGAVVNRANDLVQMWPWPDSSLQSLVPKTNALSIMQQSRATASPLVRSAALPWRVDESAFPFQS